MASLPHESLLLPLLLLLLFSFTEGDDAETVWKERGDREAALRSIHAVSTGARGAICVTHGWLLLPVHFNTARYTLARRQADSSATMLRMIGTNASSEVLDAITVALGQIDSGIRAARILVFTNDIADRSDLQIIRMASSPYPEETPSSKTPWLQTVFRENYSSYENGTEDVMGDVSGHWTTPYYSCGVGKWLMSYNILLREMKPNSVNALISLDFDLSNLEVNQCEKSKSDINQIEIFHGSHKCSNLTTECDYRAGRGAGAGAGAGGGWARGAYVCKCRAGFYSPTHPDGFNGSLVEVGWQERGEEFDDGTKDVGGWAALRCLPCAEGCATCTSPRPCRASYNWPFRSVLLGISAWCAACTALLAGYLHRHRRARVFRSASPIFLAITLLGCAIMYLEMAAIFPVLDTCTCIATKWSRHLGFCITYTALLMKTWRVSLTYRVKSAHAVKLTEQQLLRWLLPVLLIALVYLGTWTLSDPPHAEDIRDSEGLKFKQCAYNWWDHSLAIGELAFLLWGVKVCYGVRHAESLYNEARLISYAIYNIAFVNCLMLMFHLLIFPQVGPDMKYFLGFLRTQLSTSVTVALVFGPKVVRVWRGFGDQWDSRAARGVSASFSLNGIGLVHPHTPPPPTPHDLVQENDELKEEVQKLAAQIEFMKIVQMELHNRHLRPRPGGHFTMPVTPHLLPQPQVNEEGEGSRGGMVTGAG